MRDTKHNIRNAKTEIRVTSHEPRATSDKCVGSALILTVVLTSLLAIVGVLFLMMARVNKITASSISKNKELDSAVETVIAKISEELILDVPGVAGAEYYDYPGPEDKWLAGLEPYEKTTGNYYWRQISDLYNKFGSTELQAAIIPDYQDSSFVGDGNSADADGDGVADSKWVELADMTSSRGKPVYAAIRIVDNGGMLNVNTAYKFDPNDLNVKHIDGSSQLQINLLALASRPYDVLTPVEIQNRVDNLLGARSPVNPSDLSGYERDVIWRYEPPYGPNTPFDISDELELRYRYLINQDAIDTRSEVLPLWELRTTGNLRSPVDSTQIDKWFINASPDKIFDANYAYRHIATTYNMDRIIAPDCNKMTNINDANVDDLYTSVRRGILDANSDYPDVNKVAAQIAVNLIDFRDGDSDVCSVIVDSDTYYGFEQPCIYISELACRLKQDSEDLNKYYRSYAVELYKPYSGDDNPDPNWWLFISNPTNPEIKTQISWSGGASPYHVIKWEDLTDPCVPLDVNATLPIQPIDNLDTASFVVFESGSVISLIRKVNDVNVVVDSVNVPGPNSISGWLVADGNGHSIQRDISQHKCIRRLWDLSTTGSGSPTLGSMNNYSSPDSNVIQAHPADGPFTNIGEIGMVFVKSAYSEGPYPIGPNDTEVTVRLNLADSAYQQIFKYLTVFDPAVYPWNDPNETRIKGRININTAPWFVLAQLPWVSQRKSYDNTALAEAIVAYRDRAMAPGGDPNYSGRSGAAGFENIGQLCNVNSGTNSNFGIDYYSRGNGDQLGFPDLTTPDQISGDDAPDDFEERDLIFARISDLVTVRSDVFTAYILVRIGTDGPQKRVIAIFDRSSVRSSDDGGMRVLAVQPVADPR